MEKRKIPYLILENGERLINVFFGDRNCIEAVKHFGDKKLNRYTDEEDFILGIMLGYDMVAQCERYIRRNKKCAEVPELIG